jgi:hypothetical protein
MNKNTAEHPYEIKRGVLLQLLVRFGGGLADGLVRGHVLGEVAARAQSPELGLFFRCLGVSTRVHTAQEQMY